jgi:hypothetical protein
MAFAVYRVEKWSTHEGEIRVERLHRIEATEEEAIERLYGNGLVRELPGEVEPTPMCSSCGEPFFYEREEGRRFLRCYGCRASRDE